MQPDPALLTLLQAKALIGPVEDWTQLAGGRTNQLWRMGKVVVKRFASADGNPRFPNDPAQEATILKHLAGHGIAPRFLGCETLGPSTYLVYEHLQGEPWREDVGPIGNLMRRLHRLLPPPGVRVLKGGSADIEAQVDRILPDLSPSVAQVLRSRRPAKAVSPSERLVLLHGDVVPGNIIVTPDGPQLIDWQCPALGDPVEDLAIFLSPAMQLIYRGRPLSDAEKETFLGAYGDSRILERLQWMQPWHHWAMAAYCAWKADRGADDYARAMKLELDALQ